MIGTIWRWTPASAPAARTAKGVPVASASRRCAMDRITVGGTG